MNDALSPAVRAAVRDYEQRARLRFGARLRWLRVFGSWARGNAHAGSDVDLAVVVDDLSRDDWREAVALAVDTEDSTGVALSPFVVSSAHFDELLARERIIAREILQHGIAP